MLRPKRAQVGMIAAIIATIQFILVLSVLHEFRGRADAVAAPEPLALSVADSARPHRAPSR